MSVFEQRLRFGMFKDTGGCHTVMQALQRAHGGALEGVQGVNILAFLHLEDKQISQNKRNLVS